MNRSDLLEHLQPAIDELVDRIAAMLPDLVRAELDALLGKLTGEAAPAKSKKSRIRRDPKPAKVIQKTGRKPNSCKKCGAVGFTSATCGKTHNVGDSLPEALDRQMDVRPKKPPTPSPPPARGTTASLRSKQPPARDGASSDERGNLVPLHKVVAFGF